MPIPSPVPYEVSRALVTLGERIQVARLRRSLTQAELAAACGISRRTLYGIENGQTGIAVGHVYAALWALGLLGTTAGVADPDTDGHGKILEAGRRAKRARRSRELLDNNDF